MDKQEIYMEEYEQFVKDYKTMEVTGERVGELVMRMAQYFASYNLKLVGAERNLSIIAAATEQQTDDNGKTISSAKAKVLTDSTNESYLYNLAKAHLQNIEQYINSLKSLQKGILNEYSHQQ